MSTNKLVKLVLFLGALMISLTQLFASVEVFSNYDTHLKVNSDNTIEVNKTLSLKNVYDVGIVPGQIEFKIARGLEGSVGNIEVIDVKAVDSYGKEVKSQVRQTQDYSVIILDVYYPLLPGFEYDFNVYYKLSYEVGGIFFKSLQIPLRESTIPIETGTFNVELPDNYHFTYLDADDTTQASISEGVATWPIQDNSPSSIHFEYSYLPLKIGPLQGSYVFWISVNILLLLFLIYEVRREIRRVREEYDQ